MRRPGPLKDYASGGPGARSPWGESPQTFDYIKKLVSCQRAPQTFDYIKKLVSCQRAPQTFDYIKNSWLVTRQRAPQTFDYIKNLVNLRRACLAERAGEDGELHAVFRHGAA